LAPGRPRLYNLAWIFQPEQQEELMNVPLLDLGVQLKTIEDEVKAAVLEVIDSTRYIMGPKVEALEERVAEYSGTAHAIGVSSGSDALLVSLMALDIGPGDVVLTTPFTFFATAGAVARLGATPVFIDIDPVTFNMSPEALGAWFVTAPAEQRDRVKAILPVHLYGQCADMDAILEVADAHDLPIIEDAAQAIGAVYPSANGPRKAGSMGLTGCFSFFPSKNLGGVGDGGMVATNDDALADKIRWLRNHGAHPKYYHAIIGGNFRLDAIQAAVLLVKLGHLDTWHAMRRENAAYYDEHLKVPGVETPPMAYARENHIYNQYVVRIPDRRDAFRAVLNEKSIGHDVYYPVPLHQQKCFAYLGCKAGDFPASEHAADQVLALPIYPELTTEMQDYVVKAFQEFYR
jgi:dTDP-4-amino-4,6-dideoxygalactose transaminase